MKENVEEHFVGQVAQKAIIERDGKILFVRNLNDDRWDLPGGRLHNNELPKDGLAREVKEEISCECVAGEIVHMKQYFHSAQNLHCLFINYAATIKDDAEIQIAEDELSEYCWMTFEEFENQSAFLNTIDALVAYSTT